MTVRPSPITITYQFSISFFFFFIWHRSPGEPIAKPPFQKISSVEFSLLRLPSLTPRRSNRRIPLPRQIGMQTTPPLSVCRESGQQGRPKAREFGRNPNAYDESRYVLCISPCRAGHSLRFCRPIHDWIRKGGEVDGSSRHGRAGALLMRAAARRMRGEAKTSHTSAWGGGAKLKRPAQSNSFVRRYTCHTTHETYDQTYRRVPTTAKVHQQVRHGRWLHMHMLMIVNRVTDDVQVFDY